MQKNIAKNLINKKKIHLKNHSLEIQKLKSLALELKSLHLQILQEINKKDITK